MAVSEYCIIRTPYLHETRFETPYDFHVHIDNRLSVLLYQAHGGLGAARRVGFGAPIRSVVLPFRAGCTMGLRRGILRTMATAVRIRLRLIGVSRVSSKITLHAGCGHFRVVRLGLGTT